MKRQLLYFLWLELSLLLLLGEGFAWWRQAQHTLEIEGTPRDTLAFYTGAAIVARGEGARLYDLELQRAVQNALLPSSVQDELSREVRGAHTLPFVSPPFAALLFLPLTALSLAEAHVVWGAIDWVLLFLLSGILVFRQRQWTWLERLVAFGASVSFAPAYYNIAQGQVSLLLLLSAGVGWALARDGHQTSAGLALALLLLKPQYALTVFIFLLMKQRWRILIGLGAGTAVLTVVSVLVVGGSGIADYLDLLTAYPRLGAAYAVFPEAMTSWSGLLSALNGGRSIWEIGGLALLTWLALAGITMALVAWCWRAPWQIENPAWGARFALVIMVATLVSPHVNIQDLSWLIFVGILIWDYQRPAPVWAILLVVMQVIFGALYALYVISPLHWYPSLIGVPALCLLLIALTWSTERQLIRLQPPSAVLTTL